MHFGSASHLTLYPYDNVFLSLPAGASIIGPRGCGLDSLPKPVVNYVFPEAPMSPDFCCGQFPTLGHLVYLGPAHFKVFSQFVNGEDFGHCYSPS